MGCLRRLAHLGRHRRCCLRWARQPIVGRASLSAAGEEQEPVPGITGGDWRAGVGVDSVGLLTQPSSVNYTVHYVNGRSHRGSAFRGRTGRNRPSGPPPVPSQDRGCIIYLEARCAQQDGGNSWRKAARAVLMATHGVCVFRGIPPTTRCDNCSVCCPDTRERKSRGSRGHWMGSAERPRIPPIGRTQTRGSREGFLTKAIRYTANSPTRSGRRVARASTRGTPMVPGTSARSTNCSPKDRTAI